MKTTGKKKILSMALLTALILTAAFFAGGCQKVPELTAPEISKTSPTLDKISVSWTPVENAMGYSVEYSTDQDFSSGSAIAVPAEDGEVCTVTGLNMATTYYFRVQANAQNEKGWGYSEYSPVINASTLNYAERANQLLSAMTTEEKAAQLIMLTTAPDGSMQNISGRPYGGVQLGSGSFVDTTPEAVTQTVAGIQNAAKVKMLVAVHEEGGTINTVSTSPAFRETPFLSPAEIYRSEGLDGIRRDADEKAALLLPLGINTNLAPVADVPYNGWQYMSYRAAAYDASEVTNYIDTVIPEMNAKGLIPVMMHFPGYGGNLNTQNGTAIDYRGLDSLKERDFLPFVKGIEDGCPIIMVSHVITTCFDGNNPASISKPVHDYLRKDMKYKGIIITDNMGEVGVRRFGADADLAVKAIANGNDMLLTPYGEESADAIAEAAANGDITEKRLNNAVKRILLLKLQKGIIK